MWFSEQVRPGVWVGFTDTTAGNLAFHVGDDSVEVTRRRDALDSELAALGSSTASLPLAYMNQVHGAVVAHPTPPPLGEANAADTVPTADAMVSLDRALAVMVADCVPVVLVGEKPGGSPVVAVAHAGRPGVESGVIAAVVAQMRSAGAEGIEAWLGPSICGQCYEVPDSMRAAVSAVVPAAYATTLWNTPALDLPAAVLAQLAAAAVLAHPAGVCTLEDPRFFSHRRAVRDGEVEGRFIGFVTTDATKQGKAAPADTAAKKESTV
ncbi:laccase domain-containing protein [Arthrobacter glacialis]|uniref:laccase domain-containing protein n=1 Tax=Arthrobacter glacialis TaxID=1664 RepID=UPI000CD41B0A|nr:laccase domain-containing protein [Arthrobacter glacialis]POH58225.1 copper oxidase [Arthrobacter glacialis]